MNENGLRVDLGTSTGEIIEFNTGTPDQNGVQWWVTGLDGWEVPDPRQKFQDKAGDHGTILLESYFDKRSLVLAGVILIPSAQGPNALEIQQKNYWTAWNKLCRIASQDIVGGETYSTLTVYELPIPRFVSTKLGGRAKYAIKPGYWKFSLPLICTDPHKYLVGVAGDPGVF